METINNIEAVNYWTGYLVSRLLSQLTDPDFAEKYKGEADQEMF